MDWSINSQINNVMNALVWSKRQKQMTEILDLSDVRHHVTFEGSFAEAEHEKVWELISHYLLENEDSRILFKEEKLSENTVSWWGVIGQYNNPPPTTIWNLEFSRHGGILVQAISENHEFAERLVSRFKDGLNRLEKEMPEDLVSIKICWSTPHGINHSWTNMLCPRWETISDNYTERTRISVQNTIQKINHAGGAEGKLIIWHGDPGTGKTWMIRHLILALKESHNVLVITDSDWFMSDSAYYYSVIRESDKPILFVMEDAAEGILSETRVHNGGKIARVLNLTDGLIAHGRNDLFLITFNEEVENIDQAVVRPGRCLGITHFEPFNQSEAKRWLEKKDPSRSTRIDNKFYTIADLYGMIRGTEERSHKLQAVGGDQKQFGFAYPEDGVVKAEPRNFINR